MKNGEQYLTRFVRAASLHGAGEMTAKNHSTTSIACSDKPGRSGIEAHAEVFTWLSPEFSAANIWQKIACLNIEKMNLELILEQLAALIGQAFQVDACTIVQPTQLGAAPDALQPTQVVSWFAGVPQPAVQTLSPAAARRLTNPEQIAIADLAGVPLDQTHPQVRSLVKVWRLLKPDEQPVQDARALLAVPTQQAAIGLVSLWRSRPHEWTAAEVRGLEFIAHQLEVVLSHWHHQQRFDRQLQYQQVVNQLTLAIRNASDLNEILKLATDGAAQVLQMQRGMLLRLKYCEHIARQRSDAQPARVRVLLDYEWRSEVEASPLVERLRSEELLATSPLVTLKSSFRLSECQLCQRAVATSLRPIVLHDFQHWQQENFTTVAPLFDRAEFPSLLLAPLESQGTVLGFLVFQGTEPRQWQSAALELVELVSAQVSTAIIQAETLRQVQALVDKRTAELHQSLTVQAKLYERTRRQLDQLRHLNQVKDEFLSTVSHELRTPLTSMTLAIRLLRQVGTSDDRGGRYLDILEQQCAQEANLIHDLLALQESESNQVSLQPQTLEIGQLIRELMESLHPRWASKGLSLMLDLPVPLTLQSDRETLNRILLELLTNAEKYSDPNCCIKLKVMHQQAGQPPLSAAGTIVLTLCNRGTGISPAELPYIFDKFRRCQGATQNAIQGIGLGLALVKSLVQQLQGTITAASYPISQSSDWETCFTLTLPQMSDRSKL
jgi:signal transduction histidine kinase